LKIGIVLGHGGKSSPYNQMAILGLGMGKERFNVSYEALAPENEEEIAILLEGMAKSREFELVIGFGYASGKPIRQLSKDWIHQKFAVVDSRVEAPNVASYIARQVDIGFWAGYAAAVLSKTGTIGAIFGVDDENMRRWITGYTFGAQAGNPTMRVLYSFVGSWDDPQRANQLANAQFGAGADIIMAHANNGDPGILVAAESRSKYVIGWSGERFQYPKRVLLDVERHAEFCVLNAIEMTASRNFRPGVYVFGLAEGNWDLKLSDNQPMFTEGARKRIEEAKQQIIQGLYKLPEAEDLSSVNATRID
jgi:basic membrane protein A